MAEMNERTQPYDINAEAAVLSAMLIDSYAVAKALEGLKEEHFYRSAHKIIFRMMQDLFEEHQEIDLITLTDRLDREGLLEKVGGSIYMNELSDVVVSSANLDYHAKIVLEKALLRQLIIASNTIIEHCYEADRPVDDIVDEAEQAIFAVAERPWSRAFVKISDIIPETLRNIEEVAKTRSSTVGLSSGFRDLDAAIGGFRPGQFIVIAARPAMGKSSLALNIAFNAAMYHDKKIGIFTMEMANDELLMRMISSAAEVRMDDMLKGYGINEAKMLRITQAADALTRKPLYIDDAGTNTALDIRAKSRRLSAEIGGLDLIVIDYLQLMTSQKNRDNRQQEISEISRAMKILAKELKIPIIALSQLNRAVDNRPTKKPMLSDLRESGAIEQDADIVMMIYREEYYFPEKEDRHGIAEIIIAKNRHGATGTVEMLFKSEFTTFSDRMISDDGTGF
ncbi:MAG TPA: replicative DNA helicase [Candidatus Cloacimonadota bacterium]|nr:replicative DNA helicase [Candidatus Cloacimonadota bacterium]